MEMFNKHFPCSLFSVARSHKILFESNPSTIDTAFVELNVSMQGYVASKVQSTSKWNITYKQSLKVEM